MLIVLTNSDQSVSFEQKNVHGDRPINQLAERMTVLGELEFVNHVVAFNSPTILPILEELHGVTYVKTRKDVGSESVKREMEVVNRNWGRNVVYPPLMDTSRKDLMSSTRLINGTKTVEDVLEKTEIAGYSELVRDKFEELMRSLQTWDSATQQISRWRIKMRQKHKLAMSQRSDSEQEVAKQISEAMPK